MGDREACDECKVKCLLFHGEKKDSSPVVTTFHKLLYGKYDMSKYLYLPRKVSQTIPILVDGGSHFLEDSNGQQWRVTLRNKNGALAFDKGWDKFFADHGLREGYTLAFHYTLESHFVVQIIDNTGFEKLKFPKANRKKRKRSEIDGNYNAVGEYENISNNSAKNKDSAIPVTSYSEVREHSQPMNMEKPSSASVISKAANGTQSQPMSKNKPSNLENGNGIYQPVLSVDCDIEPLYMINRDAGYRHEEDRNLLLDLSNYEMQCSADAYGSGDKISRPSKTLAASDTVANIANENPVSGKVASGVSPSEVSAFKISDNNNVTSKKEKVAVFENDRHRDHPSVLPIKKGSQVHTENRIKSSTTSSKRVKCEEAVGNKNYSSEIVKLPKQETVELGKLPSCEHMCSGKYPKSNNEWDKNFGGAEKDNEVRKVVKTEPVDSFNEDRLDASAYRFTVVVGSREFLELPTSISLWTRVEKKVVNLKGPDERVWPVLYHHKYGIKALTSGWENFVKSYRLRTGDQCDFILVNEAETIFRVDALK